MKPRLSKCHSVHAPWLLSGANWRFLRQLEEAFENSAFQCRPIEFLKVIATLVFIAFAWQMVVPFHCKSSLSDLMFHYRVSFKVLWVCFSLFSHSTHFIDHNPPRHIKPASSVSISFISLSFGVWRVWTFVIKSEVPNWLRCDGHNHSLYYHLRPIQTVLSPQMGV